MFKMIYIEQAKIKADYKPLLEKAKTNDYLAAMLRQSIEHNDSKDRISKLIKDIKSNIEDLEKELWK